MSCALYGFSRKSAILKMQRARRFVANQASQLLHEAAEDAYQAATEEVAVLHQGLNGHLDGVGVQ